MRFAAEAAKVNEFLDDSPDGLGTMCLERGARFSGGQRQRIALARALYRWPELLVLDEATSALDRESVGAILERLKLIKLTGVTCIMITHDRRLTELADRTFIVDNRRLKIQSRDVG